MLESRSLGPLLTLLSLLLTGTQRSSCLVLPAPTRTKSGLVLALPLRVHLPGGAQEVAEPWSSLHLQPRPVLGPWGFLLCVRGSAELPQHRGSFRKGTDRGRQVPCVDGPALAHTGTPVR